MSRTEKGTFAAGQSGNPAGRPKGALGKVTRWREALEPHGDELFKVAVEHALDGDMTALKLCLERISPPVKAASDPVEFALHGSTLAEKAESVLEAIAAGIIDVPSGRQLIGAIADLGKILEITELEKRLAQLEQLQEMKK
ncbi:MAG: hypothetical protein GX673_11100 [Gammaproteobacteria bacterium]|nr:hypothetical protein [Gammaproteobacteria bacterium]